MFLKRQIARGTCLKVHSVNEVLFVRWSFVREVLRRRKVRSVPFLNVPDAVWSVQVALGSVFGQFLIGSVAESVFVMRSVFAPVRHIVEDPHAEALLFLRVEADGVPDPAHLLNERRRPFEGADVVVKSAPAVFVVMKFFDVPPIVPAAGERCFVFHLIWSMCGGKSLIGTDPDPEAAPADG